MNKHERENVRELRLRALALMGRTLNADRMRCAQLEVPYTPSPEYLNARDWFEAAHALLNQPQQKG